MSKAKIIRITTVPISLEKLLEGQLSFMKQYFQVIAVASEKERLVQFGLDQDVDTYYVNLTRKITPIQDLRAVYSLYRFFRDEKPEIVHTHTPKAGIVGMMAAYLARVPIRMHTVAGLPLMEATGVKRLILNFVEKMTYRFATKVYPNSLGLKNFIELEGFAASNKLKIIGDGSSNGIDTTYFSKSHFTKQQCQKLRKELEIPENDIVFVFVGRLVGDKGINELISAFARVQENHLCSTLLLVGPFEDDLDPLLPETKRTIQTHSKIKAVGYQTDVRLYLAISDVLAFPSYREGFPNVVMQAGAMELPAIVSDINGCNEIIETQRNGIIVPKKDDEALEFAMSKMIEQPEVLQALSSEARTIVTTRYERKKIWQLLLKEYHALLDNM